MKENKNIERLFQEKFKDFEVSPPDFVWENIQEKLHPEEKKRRVIPFWFKTAGIAASFVAFFSVVVYNSDSPFNNTINNNAVVNSNTKKENSRDNKNNSSESKQNQNNTNFRAVNDVKRNATSHTIVEVTSTNSVSNSKLNRNEIENATTYNTKFETNHKSVSNFKTNSKINSRAITNSKVFNAKNNLVSNQKKTTNYHSLQKDKATFNGSNFELVAIKKYTNKSKNKSKTNSDFNNFNTNSDSFLNSKITDVNTFNPIKNINSNSGVVNVNTFKNNNSNTAITDTNFNSLSNLPSKNNTDGLAENGLENSNNSTAAVVAVEETKIDTIALATVITEENPMEKLLREKETKKVVDEKEKWSKWAVNSFVSPIFFNSFANGSPLSDEFATNEKTFNNSTSYGIGVAYNINKRLAIKTGVSNLTLDFDTENIAFYSSFEDQSKISNTNIERNANGKYLILKHEKDVSRNAVENQIIQASQDLGNLNQKTQYIEVPFEMSYAIVNRKIGVAIKGGMSTLFLTENSISINGDDGNMQIGKASNLNNVHFSSNIGLGLSYSIMKNFQLNVEPSLRYQINTYNKNSTDFTPYVVGVNTGISYKF